jgi:hypothetical protein
MHKRRMISGRTDETTRRWRTLLQARADELLAAILTIQQPTDLVGFTVDFVEDIDRMHFLSVGDQMVSRDVVGTSRAEGSGAT